VSNKALYLVHHGILGQRWGTRNGPPYPLKGGSYSRSEVTAIKKERSKKYSRYNKKHYDEVLKKGTVLRTLSYDQNRTKDTDMFFAAHTKKDIDHYKAFFDKAMKQPIYDKNGNEIGSGSFLKYSIQNKAIKDLKIASEDSGSKAFKKLYENDRDFYNFVTDPNRLRNHFESGIHKISPGYASARKSMDRLQDPDYKPSEKDLDTAYRIFNHSIPSMGNDNRSRQDMYNQRSKLFKELKSNGYDALLDTNDSLYNSVQAESPVIVFNMDSVVPDSVYRTTTAEVRKSKIVNAMRHVFSN